MIQNYNKISKKVLYSSLSTVLLFSSAILPTTAVNAATDEVATSENLPQTRGRELHFSRLTVSIENEKHTNNGNHGLVSGQTYSGHVDINYYGSIDANPNYVELTSTNPNVKIETIHNQTNSNNNPSTSPYKNGQITVYFTITITGKVGQYIHNNFGATYTDIETNETFSYPGDDFSFEVIENSQNVVSPTIETHDSELYVDDKWNEADNFDFVTDSKSNKSDIFNHDIKTSGNVNTSKPGSYTVTYRFKDPYTGEKVSKSATIRVYSRTENQLPVNTVVKVHDVTDNIDLPSHTLFGKKDDIVDITEIVNQLTEQHYAVQAIPATAVRYGDGNVIQLNVIHQTKVSNISKSFTQTVHFVDQDGNKLKDDLNDTKTISAKKTKDLVTNKETIGDWSTAAFEEVTIPQIEGYTTNFKDIKATPATKNSEITVTYQKNIETAKTVVKIFDDSTGNEFPEQILSGKKGNAVKYSSIIDKLKAQHYHIESLSGQLAHYGDGTTIVIHVSHQTISLSTSTDIHQTIHFIDEDGNKLKVDDQVSKTVTGSYEKDLVTGATTQVNIPNASFAEYAAPEIEGYTPKIDKIDEFDSANDVENTIVYRKNFVIPENPDLNTPTVDPGNYQNPENSNPGYEQHTRPENPDLNTPTVDPGDYQNPENSNPGYEQHTRPEHPDLNTPTVDPGDYQNPENSNPGYEQHTRPENPDLNTPTVDPTTPSTPANPNRPGITDPDLITPTVDPIGSGDNDVDFPSTDPTNPEKPTDSVDSTDSSHSDDQPSQEENSTTPTTQDSDSTTKTEDNVNSNLPTTENTIPTSVLNTSNETSTNTQNDELPQTGDHNETTLSVLGAVILAFTTLMATIFKKQKN